MITRVMILFYYTCEMVNLCYIRNFHLIIHGYLVGNLFVKATNINYIRLSHYTPAKGFIELCDEIGEGAGDPARLTALLFPLFPQNIPTPMVIQDLAGSVSC